MKAGAYFWIQAEPNNIPNNPLEKQYTKHTFCNDNKNYNLPKAKSNKDVFDNQKENTALLK